MKKEKIFISFPAFNEEDVRLTIDTALQNAFDPLRVFFGIALHYTYENFPDLSMYSNVKYVKIDDNVGWGTGQTRAIAASLRQEEDYYLQIDGHTIFKKNWDKKLLNAYKRINSFCEKPIISTYVPFWYKDENGKIFNQEGNEDIQKEMTTNFLTLRQERLPYFTDYGIPAPTWGGIVDKDQVETYLISAHFLFTKIEYLEEVPFDTQITYFEENTTALRAWTRGYKFFAIKEDVLATREMFKGTDVKNSWRSSALVINKKGKNFAYMLIEGSLRCKKVLTGEILGVYGAPDLKSFEKYKEFSNFDYKSFYKEMEEYAIEHKEEAKYAYDIYI